MSVDLIVAEKKTLEAYYISDVFLNVYHTWTHKRAAAAGAEETSAPRGGQLLSPQTKSITWMNSKNFNI